MVEPDEALRTLLRRRSRRLRIALAAASLSAALGAGEISARVLFPALPDVRFEQLGDVHEGRDTSQFLGLVDRDSEVFWRLAPGTTLPEDSRPFFGLVSNARGLREDHEIPRDKGAGEVRLLFLGDSCTFGFGLGPQDTFVQLAEEALRVRFSGTEIECINAGVPGWSLFQGWRMLETEGFAYEPDLVVLAFGWNDNDVWDGDSDMEHHRIRSASRPPPGLRWSRLAEIALAASHTRRSSAPASRRPRLLPEEFIELLERIEVATREHGVDLLLLVLPARVNLDPATARSGRLPLQLVQLEFGAKRKLGPGGPPAFVDGVAAVHAVEKAHMSAELFLDQVHPTALGNRVIAAALIERIEPWLRVKLER